MPTTDVPTIEDAIAEIAAAKGDEKRAKVRELAKKIRAEAPEVANYLITSGKNQVGPRIEQLEKQVDELTTELEAKETELSEVRAKAPDTNAAVEAERRKAEQKITKEKERADAAEQRLIAQGKQIAKDKLILRLVTPNEQGQRVDREYAELVAAAKLDDRFVVRPDGAIAVKQIGEDVEYDGDSLDAKVDALAKDYRPTVPPSFMLTAADSGAGIRSTGGGAVGTKTTQQIIDDKRRSGQYVM